MSSAPRAGGYQPHIPGGSRPDTPPHGGSSVQGPAPAYRAICHAPVGTYESESGWKSATAHEVIEVERKPVAIGIVDASGVMIYRVPGERRIGFDLSARTSSVGGAKR